MKGEIILYHMELSKDEKAYLRMLESKRDGLVRQINRLNQDRIKICIEIDKINNGKMNLDFHQTEINWEEV